MSFCSGYDNLSYQNHRVPLKACLNIARNCKMSRKKFVNWLKNGEENKKEHITL